MIGLGQIYLDLWIPFEMSGSSERRALLVGINSYENANSLNACVADAQEMALVLSRHKDGAPNFDCRALLDKMENDDPINRKNLRAACRELFDGFKGNVLLYFSGHGIVTNEGGYLCTSDASEDDWGVPMDEIIAMAMHSSASDVLFLLDCCHSGSIANPAILNTRLKSPNNPLALLREGMTVIAASRDSQVAVEAGGHGLFTAALLDALNGGAADHMGWVSAPAIYLYTRRRFGGWEQAPVYKSHAIDISVVRECEPLIDRLKLHQLTTLFPVADFHLRLDPEYEPEDEHGNTKGVVNEEKVEVARLLKEYRDAGLLRATEANLQLFWVARRSETVQLTQRGREYWWLVKNNKI